MSSLRIALIACANGFGHVRRMLSLSLALRDRGALPVLFAPKSTVHRIATSRGIAVPEVVDFQSRTTRADWMVPDTRCWTEYLTSLEEFDEVVSDNLIEILQVRPKAWLSGSFFWHLALPDFPPQRAARAEELLARYRPRMITTGLFAAPYLAAKTRLHIVGMYALGQAIRRSEKRDVLISCGKGGDAETMTMTLLQKIASVARPGQFTVWVEPALYCKDMPDWMQPATFTPAMYGRLAAAVIRPGVGTVTDVLLAGARLFMYHESDNLEMTHNARRITDAGLGEVFISVEDAWLAGVYFARHRGTKHPLMTSLRTQSFYGADQAARILLTASHEG